LSRPFCTLDEQGNKITPRRDPPKRRALDEVFSSSPGKAEKASRPKKKLKFSHRPPETVSLPLFLPFSPLRLIYLLFLLFLLSRSRSQAEL